MSCRLERGKDPHDSTPEETGPIAETDDTGIQPLRDGDTSVTADPAATGRRPSGTEQRCSTRVHRADELTAATATGVDLDEIRVG